MRGGDPGRTRHHQPLLGSSPRARGRRAKRVREGRIPGFIPACAGETAWCRSWRRTRRVHPRVRGGDGDQWKVAAGPGGSSPRARGRPCAPPCQLPKPGFIPACAGETQRRRRIARGREVHPRVRGGDDGESRCVSGGDGSSPRARGRLAIEIAQHGAIGFIPACAGETFAIKHSMRPRRVHPRVRGGDPHGCGLRRAPDGSSPRARGRRR